MARFAGSQLMEEVSELSRPVVEICNTMQDYAIITAAMDSMEQGLCAGSSALQVGIIILQVATKIYSGGTSKKPMEEGPASYQEIAATSNMMLGFAILTVIMSFMALDQSAGNNVEEKLHSIAEQLVPQIMQHVLRRFSQWFKV